MNLFENLCMMKESEEVKVFNISFKANDVYQANLIKGYSEEQVTEYFKAYKPNAEVLGVKVATKDDEKPGKPVIDATKDVVKEADPITDDPDWENTFDEVPVFETEYVFNNERYSVTLTEEEKYINVHINDDVYLQEPKEYVKDDHDLEYLAFSTVVDYYKELRFADKIEESAILKDEKDIETIVENTELRPFNSRDRLTWGGENEFADGSEPMIVDGEFATILVGQSDEQVGTEDACISIYYGDSEGSEPEWGFKNYKNKESAIKDAKLLAKLADEEIDVEQLKRFGFEIIGVL